MPTRTRSLAPQSMPSTTDASPPVVVRRAPAATEPRPVLTAEEAAARGARLPRGTTCVRFWEVAK